MFFKRVGNLVSGVILVAKKKVRKIKPGNRVVVGRGRDSARAAFTRPTSVRRPTRRGSMERRIHFPDQPVAEPATPGAENEPRREHNRLRPGEGQEILRAWLDYEESIGTEAAEAGRVAWIRNESERRGLHNMRPVSSCLANYRGGHADRRNSSRSL